MGLDLGTSIPALRKTAFPWRISHPRAKTRGKPTIPENRRIQKKKNGVFQKAWLYRDELRPIAELDAMGNVVSRFVYALGRNVPDYMVKGGNKYRLITDQVGSVRMVVDAATGVVAQKISYDEFGVVSSDTNPGFQPFGFAGGLYDAATGLVRFGARDYDSEVGRWTAKDPSRFDGGDSNLYGYVANDPLNRTDPTGLLTPLQKCKLFVNAITAGCVVACTVFVETPAAYGFCLTGCFAIGAKGLKECEKDEKKRQSECGP